jgi:hypothetical protein
MATIASDHASPTARGRKRRDAQGKVEGKKFTCEHNGCGRTFTRAEHLQRHLLNHSSGDYTCDRCRAHFKRKDLLGKMSKSHCICTDALSARFSLVTSACVYLLEHYHFKCVTTVAHRVFILSPSAQTSASLCTDAQDCSFIVSRDNIIALSRMSMRSAPPLVSGAVHTTSRCLNDLNSYSLTLSLILAWSLTFSQDRHMTRHRQKDEEAGAEGCGILNTRKVICPMQ